MPDARAGARRPVEVDEVPQGDQSAWQSTVRSMIQVGGIFLVMQFVMSKFGPQQAQKTSPSTEFKPGQSQPITSSYSHIPQMINPIWPANVSLDVSMYISPSVVMPSLKNMPAESLVLREKGFKYGDYSDKRDASITFKVPREVQNNGTLWAHIYVAQSGSVIDPTEPGYDTNKAYRMTRPLTQHLLKKKEKKVKNLMASKDEAEVEVSEPGQTGPTVANYYHPNFTAAFIPNTGSLKYTTMHPATRQFVQLEPTGARDESGQNGWYYPVLYVNTFWQLKSEMTVLNDTVKELPLNVQLNHLANWKFNLMASMDEGMKETARKNALGESTPGGGDGSEMELVKETLLGTSIYLLGTTAIVSLLHMVFEMLAFKSDVSHWRKKKDNVGTSFRTIVANIIMQAIILLYLIDQNENTSWMILMSQGMGIVIEAWKITKTVDVRIRQSPPGSLIPYRVTFEDKHKLSETEKQTEEYDQIAFKYLYIAGVPLLIAYAIYSLYYEEHASVYSYVIQVLVGSVYAYGFLLMCPALYINYRLQSVAHMNLKAMTFKCLNTFIDDLFAFTIKMPWLYRLSVFRDDIIFFIYLYQSWVYRIDYKRVNEFGIGGDAEDVDEKKTNKPLTSPPGADEKSDAVKEVEAKTTSASKGEGAKKRK